MIEAPELLKMIEPAIAIPQIEAAKVLKTIENMPEMKMLEANYGRPLEIEDFQKREILPNSLQSMIEFPPEQRIAVNQQPVYSNNEEPYVTFPTVETNYDLENLLTNPFETEMDCEQPAITYPEEAQMTEEIQLFKPAEMPEEVYFQSNPSMQQRLIILPSPRSKLAILPRRSKRLIQRNNKRRNFNVQNLDLKQILNTDIVDLQKQNLPVIRELEAIESLTVMKKLKAPMQRLAIESANNTQLAIKDVNNMALVKQNNRNIANSYNGKEIIAPTRRLAITNTKGISERAIIPRIRKAQQVVALPKRRRPKLKYMITFPAEQQAVSNLINRYKAPKRKRKRHRNLAITNGNEANTQLIEAEAAKRWNDQINLLNTIY